MVGHLCSERCAGRRPGTPEGEAARALIVDALRGAGLDPPIGGAEDGVIVRRADAEIIPPLSDYYPFWQRQVPFMFLTAGRSRHYHTPQDTPEKLDYTKMEATARWLERFVRETCARPEPRIASFPERRDDAATLRSLASVTRTLEAVSPQAAAGRKAAEALLRECDSEGRLPLPRRPEAQMLVGLLEQGLA